MLTARLPRTQNRQSASELHADLARFLYVELDQRLNRHNRRRFVSLLYRRFNKALTPPARYLPTGNLAFGSTNVFWRQIRNFVLDMTLVPANSSMTGIHWPTAQATSIQNVVFEMNSNSDTQHQGVFIESGSGGFMNDLIFNGGMIGGNWGALRLPVAFLISANRSITFSGNQQFVRAPSSCQPCSFRSIC